MLNRITKETWKLWQKEIAYHIRNEEKSNADFTAEEILKYLEDEGAFTLVEED